MLKHHEPTFIENTLTAIISREEYESRGLITHTKHRYMFDLIDGYAVLNYTAGLLHYYFGEDWQHEISLSMMADMIKDDLIEMETFYKIPHKYSNFHGVPDDLEDILDFKVQIGSMITNPQDGVTVKFYITEVESR